MPNFDWYQKCKKKFFKNVDVSTTISCTSFLQSLMDMSNYFLKYVTCKNGIFECSPAHVTLCHFFSNSPVPLCHLQKVTNCTKKQKIFFYIWLLKHINIIIKEVEKVRNCCFNLFVNSLLHINTHLLTNYVDKNGEV